MSLATDGQDGNGLQAFKFQSKAHAKSTGWLETLNVEAYLTVIAPNSSNHSANLRIPSVDSILKRNANLFICL